MNALGRMILLALFTCLSLAGCAPRDDSARDDDWQGVFYGGVQGGRSLAHGEGQDM